MPKLGLGNKSTNSGLVTPGIITDNLVLKHNYNTGSLKPISDGAALFDGTDDYISISETTSLYPSSITVSAWIKLPGEAPTENYPRIIDADGDSKGWHLRYTKSDTRFVARVSDDGTNHELIQSDTIYNDYNKWYHVAFTYNSSDGVGKIYIDGVHDGTDTLAGGGALNDPSGDIAIGREGHESANEWDGFICNVGVWSSVLTQAQIKSIMNKNYAGLSDSEKTNLVSWWNLSADANDSHGSNHGTLS